MDHHLPSQTGTYIALTRGPIQLLHEIRCFSAALWSSTSVDSPTVTGAFGVWVVVSTHVVALKRRGIAGLLVACAIQPSASTLEDAVLHWREVSDLLGTGGEASSAPVELYSSSFLLMLFEAYERSTSSYTSEWFASKLSCMTPRDLSVLRAVNSMAVVFVLFQMTTLEGKWE